MPLLDISHLTSCPVQTTRIAGSQSSSPQATIYEGWPTPTASNSSLELVHRLPELPVPESVAAHLLDLVFSSIPTIGILEVFTGLHDPPLPQVGSLPVFLKRPNASLNPLFHSKPLLYTLIALGAILCSRPDATVNVISLQQYAVNSVPALYGNSRDLRIDHALSLCLLSYMGCLNVSSLKVAERWAVLAVVISRQANEIDADTSPEWEICRQRASWLICIVDRYAGPLMKLRNSSLTGLFLSQ